ncbi:hypothetical protein MSAN_02272800 [Mycena sanguinolenta]|uniref:Protein kinase domain-containing protein n=1 Tax=Mycena sanguinolenta TaxID=230812 RepID=A0A8H6XB01_9AGAR|nr:hypothetical protein MSAN_02272800 [Mycena sanguinolenta]
MQAPSGPRPLLPPFPSSLRWTPQSESDPESSAVSTNNAQLASYASAFWPQASPFFPSALTTMHPQAESNPEVGAVSTNNAEWDSALWPQASPFFPSTLTTIDSQAESDPELSLMSTNTAEWNSYASAVWPQTSETSGRSVINHFHIGGGVGGTGGDARDWGTGGGGGAGHGPTLNFYNSPEESLSPFRTIRLGDLDLVKEIRLVGQFCVVCGSTQGAGVRRMYSANLVDRESRRKVTVVMYQGDGAEQEWRRDRAVYESIRHPNILQLYGLVTNTKLCAMVFHDELIPYNQFLRRFEHSPVLTTYISAYCRTEWNDARDYHNSIFPMADLEDYFGDLPLWIRPATGQLCVDLSPGQTEDGPLLDMTRQERTLRLENITLDDANAEALVVSSLDEDKYHKLCSRDPIAQWRRCSISPRLPICYPPTVCQLDSKQKTLVMLTKPLDFHPEIKLAWDIHRVHEQEVLPNSWMRYDACEAYDLFLLLPMYRDSSIFWLAQANHIFSQLQTTSEFEDYMLLTEVVFCLTCLPHLSNTLAPDGYLFVCPAEDFRTGENSLKWPECPAYWSLDPSGAVPLSSEDAKTLGFPIIHIETFLYGYFWDESVHQGVRQFHAGKGFDPDSQDMARDLGYPLFAISTEELPSLTYIEEWPIYCNTKDPARCQVLARPMIYGSLILAHMVTNKQFCAEHPNSPSGAGVRRRSTMRAQVVRDVRAGARAVDIFDEARAAVPLDVTVSAVHQASAAASANRFQFIGSDPYLKASVPLLSPECECRSNGYLV